MKTPRSPPPPHLKLAASPSQLRDAAEAELAQIDRSPPDAAIPSDDKLLHELQVHQVELEIQNECLRQAQETLEASRDRYADLYDFAPVGYLTLSRETQIIDINLTGTSLLGNGRTSPRNHRFGHFVAPEEQERWNNHFLYAIGHEGYHACDLKLKRSDGTSFHAHLNSLPVPGPDGTQALRITLTDISQLKEAENKLRIAAVVFDSMEGILITDPEGVILRVNRAFTELTGYTAEEAVGKTPALLSSGRHGPEFYLRMWQVIKTNGYWQGEVWNRRKSGKIYAEWLIISAVTDEYGRFTHYVGTFSEITENKEAEAKIHRLAYYDSLTHLPNRRLLQDRIGQALAGSSRTEHHGALIFLDLDNFKKLNDTRGHDIGDRLLIDTAERLQANVREGDTVARLGGDEFVVMLEDLSNEAQEAAIQAKLVGEKILDAIGQPYDLDGHEFFCTASMGISLFKGHDESVEALLRHADLAMYKAKSAGRNTLQFFDQAMQTALDQRSSLETDLRQAQRLAQLSLYYQPQIDEFRRIVGAEALLRWRHPAHGLIPPNDFIPLAEETGLIIPIGQWVLEIACAQLKAWSGSPATRDLRLAVNVSVRQFRQPDFVAQVRQVLANSGANPKRLKIELTESLVIDNVNDTIERMQALKALGVAFSMDDFGTGFSSLSYLKRLPLDQLKIDRSFVRDIASDPNDAAIVRTIITMGKTLGLDVIAEGVETEAQLSQLREYGCLAYQGYLFARPLPPEGFDDLIRQSQWSGNSRQSD